MNFIKESGDREKETSYSSDACDPLQISNQQNVTTIYLDVQIQRVITLNECVKIKKRCTCV